MRKRVIFMGEKHLGLKCLRLLEGMPEVDLLGVCTRARAEVWWGEQNIIDYCSQKAIPMMTRAEILEQPVDHLISVLYPFIVEGKYIRHAKMKCYNLHEAPLPKWKGCNGYSHAIMSGDTEYATTLHQMVAELDTGGIITERRFPIKPNETAKELYTRTENESYQLALEWFPRLIRNKITALEPSDRDVSILNRRDSLAEHKQLELKTKVDDAYRIVRSLDFVPFEPAFVNAAGRKYYMFIKGALGRESLPEYLPTKISPVSRLMEIPWGTFSCGVLENLPRAMVLCDDITYGQLFSIYN